MSRTYVRQFTCDHCATVSANDTGWKDYSFETDRRNYAIDFCPTCVESLGQKELMKEWIDATDAFNGLS